MELADELIKRGVLKNPRLIEAFRMMDRKNFVPDGLAQLAYADEPLPIGEGQTISQPWTVAFMLELLDPQPGENILEIGYGSGWQTALIAATGANVCAIERIPRLCELGKNNVEEFFSFSEVAQQAVFRKSLPPNPADGIGRAPALDLRKTLVALPKFFCQDGTKGLPEVAKQIGGFDKIIVAAASDAAKIPSGNGTAAILPTAWKEQLKIGGSIVAPIEHSIFLFIKKAHNQFDEREYPGFAFVPLVEEN